MYRDIVPKPDFQNSEWASIVLAGGCFWGVEAWFKRLRGVLATECGYANGADTDTSYQTLAATDHSEAVSIWYDPIIIPLPDLLDLFLQIIDPYSLNRQGNDVGRQYRTGIYYIDEADRDVALAKLAELEQSSGRKPAVEVEPLQNYVRAEAYHQDYLAKNPGGYCHIDIDAIPQAWLKPSFDATQLKEKDLAVAEAKQPELTRRVMLESGTERPFSSPLDQEYAPGLYVDRITGEPLFLSSTKFSGGCGWPSFALPLDDALTYHEDHSLGRSRIEVRSKAGDYHLGHVFRDGPQDMGGLRYCINGAALKFIPYDELSANGYSAYIPFVKPYVEAIAALTEKSDDT
ncbi:MAG TPA: peptide-methionine (S)-S-oxide reductase MsrA [Clostridiaceae bacterium]|nr:peptide-methionine (S)-S-oxide reductase MsrA [Clostridiaceae bacterium]